MSFISYAQNFEDIILWRALKHVAKGFYIDVGANDPTVDSVTRAFYDRGWHGINVEPMLQYHSRLAIERPVDINLAVAVGETSGELRFFDVADTGLSTMDEAIAAAHVAAGRSVTERPVRIMRLADICRAHVDNAIHFLKIDVEGFEAAVLRGMDFTQWRPWILVIEATRPQSQVRSNEAWSGLVLGSGYQFAYFDGLNDYYVAEEHAELMAAFQAPPNFFDDFILRSGHFFSYPLADLENRIWQISVKFDAAEKAAKEARDWGVASSERAERAELLASKTAEQIELARQDTDQARQATAQAQAQGVLLNNRVIQLELENERASTRAVQAELMTVQLQANLGALHHSVSWKVTRPLRLVRRLQTHPQPARAIARVLIRQTRQRFANLGRWVARQHPLTVAVRNLSSDFPKLALRLESLMVRLEPATTSTATAEPVIESQQPDARLVPAPTVSESVARTTVQLRRTLGRGTSMQSEPAAALDPTANPSTPTSESNAHRS